MRIAVCDDEMQVTYEVRRYLQQYYGEKAVIDLYNSGEKLLKRNKDYEIFFLDISMDTIGGIELAKLIRKDNPKSFIIFVTNYNDYFQRAFSLHAFEYILKPVTRKRIFEVLDDITVYKRNDIQEQCVPVKTEKGIVSVMIGKMNYFEYTGRKVRLVLDDRSLLLPVALKDLDYFIKDYGFFSPHRAFIVNPRKMKAIKRYDIIMENGEEVPIAQKKAAAFKKEYERYLFRQIESRF